MTNNEIFKKIRAYLVRSGLKDKEIMGMFGEPPISVSRFNGLKAGNDNPGYKPMQDSELARFLDGLVASAEKRE